MKIIGICGSSGSGKSTVCLCFEKLGIPILDCDKIYHELVEKPSDCLSEIGEVFGSDLIENGYLDRKKLGKIVFNDRKKLDLLNRISHLHVKLQLKKRMLELSAESYPACIIDAPMLFEAGLDRSCDAVIAVVADQKVQLSRICARDCIDEESATLRLSNQISSEELKTRADFVIENNGTLSDLEVQCNKVLNLILTTEGEE